MSEARQPCKWVHVGAGYWSPQETTPEVCSIYHKVLERCGRLALSWVSPWCALKVWETIPFETAKQFSFSYVVQYFFKLIHAMKKELRYSWYLLHVLANTTQRWCAKCSARRSHKNWQWRTRRACLLTLQTRKGNIHIHEPGAPAVHDGLLLRKHRVIWLQVVYNEIVLLS